MKKLIEEIDQNYDIDDTRLPVHTGAILGDIRKKFSQDIIIKDEIRFLRNSRKSPLKKVMNVRNRAAHADISGEKREVKQQEIGSYKNDFTKFIAILVNIVLRAKKMQTRKIGDHDYGTRR